MAGYRSPLRVGGGTLLNWKSEKDRDMAKVMKSHTLLADDSGLVWVEAELSQTQVKRVINSYKRAGVSLIPYGSPDQLMAQLKELEGAF